MASQPGGQWFSYADTGRQLMLATCIAYHDCDREKMKPGAEQWTTIAHYSSIIRELIVSHWAKLTKLDPHRFPFTDDFVKSAWISVRKSTDNEIMMWAQGLQPSLFL